MDVEADLKEAMQIQCAIAACLVDRANASLAVARLNLKKIESNLDI